MRASRDFLWQWVFLRRAAAHESAALTKRRRPGKYSQPRCEAQSRGAWQDLRRDYISSVEKDKYGRRYRQGISGSLRHSRPILSSVMMRLCAVRARSESVASMPIRRGGAFTVSAKSI